MSFEQGDYAKIVSGHTSGLIGKVGTIIKVSKLQDIFFSLRLKNGKILFCLEHELEKVNEFKRVLEKVLSDGL